MGGGGVFKTIGSFVVVPACSSRTVLRMRYSQTCFAVVLMQLFHKAVYIVVSKVSWGVSTKASFN